MVVEKVIPTDVELLNLFGINDSNLKYLKKIFPNVKINARGNILYLDGNQNNIDKLLNLIDEMITLNQNKQSIEIPDIELLMNMNGSLNGDNKKLSTINITNNKSIKVKNDGWRLLYAKMESTHGKRKIRLRISFQKGKFG